MSTLREELRSIDVLSDSLRDVEREIYLESQILENMEKTRKKQDTQKESLLSSIEKLRASKATLSSSIMEKEKILQSNQLLENVANDEIKRLKIQLLERSKRQSKFLCNIKSLYSEMEDLVVGAFGSNAVEGTQINIQRLKSSIGENKNILMAKNEEYSRLEEDYNQIREESSLQNELCELETELESLSQKKTDLEGKIKDMSVHSPARTLNLNVTLEASTYMKYPKLMDGSSFFKTSFDKVNSNRASLKNIERKCSPKLKTPERKNRLFPSLLGYDNQRRKELNKVKKNISFESYHKGNTSPTLSPLTPVRSPYFSPDKGKSPTPEARNESSEENNVEINAPVSEEAIVDGHEIEVSQEQEMRNESPGVTADENRNESVANVSEEQLPMDQSAEYDSNKSDGEEEDDRMLFNFDNDKDNNTSEGLKSFWGDEKSTRVQGGLFAEEEGGQDNFMFGGSSGANNSFFSAVGDKDNLEESSSSFFK